MISVCIATYNGQRFIGRQITSILSQLEEGDEVIVSDDGSTDETLSVINHDRRHAAFRAGAEWPYVHLLSS